MPSPPRNRFARSVFLARDAGRHGADDRADQCNGDSEAKLLWVEGIGQRQRVRGAGNDGSVEAEEESTERADGGGLEQVGIKFHRMFATRVLLFGRLYSSGSGLGVKCEAAE
jgi:hypothetical protein